MRTTAKLLIVILLFSSVAAQAFTFGGERAISSPVYVPPAGEQRPVAVASDGSDFVVFWTDSGRRAGLYATQVRGDGTVAPVPQSPIQLGAISSVSAVWTGSVYLVVWAQDGGMYAAALSREAGTVAPPYLVAAGAVPFPGGLASNGRRALAAYATAAGNQSRAAMFDAGGRLLQASAALPADAGSTSIHVASDGDLFGIVWGTGTGPVRYRFQRVNDSGAAVDATPVTVGEVANPSPAGLSWAVGKFGFAVLDRQSGDAVQVRRYRIDGNTLQIEALPAVASAGFGGGVTWNGSDFVVYWARYSFSSFDLITLPFDQSSVQTPLHRDALGLNPLLVSNGRNFLAVWFDRTVLAGGDVTAAFLNGGATAVEAVGGRTILPVAVSAGAQRGFAIGSSSSDALVAWTEQRTDADRGLLFAVRVGLDGVPAGTPVELATDVSHANPAVTFTGAGYFVAWTKEEGGSSTVYGRLIRTDGTLSETIRLGSGFNPSAASTAATTLVAFDAGAQIALVRVTPQGALIDSTPLPFAAGTFGDVPQVASNGSGFLVVFTTGSDHYLFGTQDLIDVFAARVSESGSPDAAALPIAVGPKNQALPAVSSDGRDYLIAYALGHAPERRIAIKRVLREGQLAEGSAADDGRVIGEARALGPIAMARSAGGFVIGWTGSIPGEHLELANVTAAGVPSGGVASLEGGNGIGLAPTGSGFLAAYTRFAPESPYGSISRVFVRTGGESRAKPHAVRR